MKKVDWAGLAWILILSAIFWSAMVCSGRVGIGGGKPPEWSHPEKQP